MSESAKPELVRTVGVGAIAVVAGAALGALGGWLWWTLWQPGYSGKVYDTTIGPRWYPTVTDPGEAHQFTSVGLFATLGFGLALLLGLLTAYLMRQRAVIGIAFALAAAAAGSAVMFAVGMALSPTDPNKLASAKLIGKELPQGLVLDGWTPYLVWPVGVLLAFTAFMVLTADVQKKIATPQDPRPVPARDDRSVPSPPQ